MGASLERQKQLLTEGGHSVLNIPTCKAHVNGPSSDPCHRCIIQLWTVGVTEEVQHYNLNGHNWLKITVLVNLWCFFLSNPPEEHVFTPLQIYTNPQAFISLCSIDIPPSHTFFMLVAPFYTCTCFHDPLVGDISARQHKQAAAAAMSHLCISPSSLLVSISVAVKLTLSTN